MCLTDFQDSADTRVTYDIYKPTFPLYLCAIRLQIVVLPENGGPNTSTLQGGSGIGGNR